MKTIIVGFSRSHKITSKIITWLTGSVITHTYVRIPVPEYKTSMVFQAQGFNVHYLNYEEFLKHNTVIEEVEVEVSDEQFIEAEKIRVFECGKPYGMLELIGYLAVLIQSKVGLPVKNPFYDSDKSFVCVELVLNMLGMEDKSTMTPDKLHAMLVRRKPV